MNTREKADLYDAISDVLYSEADKQKVIDILKQAILDIDKMKKQIYVLRCVKYHHGFHEVSFEEGTYSSLEKARIAMCKIFEKCAYPAFDIYVRGDYELGRQSFVESWRNDEMYITDTLTCSKDGKKYFCDCLDGSIHDVNSKRKYVLFSGTWFKEHPAIPGDMIRLEERAIHRYYSMDFKSAVDYIKELDEDEKPPYIIQTLVNREVIDTQEISQNEQTS